MSFHGTTYEQSYNHQRLGTQRDALYDLMQDGEWRTLEEINRHVPGLITAISMRLREFRKAQYGEHRVEKRHLGNGLWQYRLLINTGQLEMF